MSALADIDVPVRQRRLKAVPSGKPKKADRPWPKAVFPLAVLFLLGGGLIGHLVLQTSIQEQAFQLADLQDQADSLSAQQAILQAALEQQSTPEQLAYAASGLGMVANPYTTYLDITTGQVTGVDQPVRGNELPSISAPPNITPPDAPIDSVAQATQPDTSSTDPSATDGGSSTETGSTPVGVTGQ